MGISIIGIIVIFALFLLISAFFSSSETALTGVSQIRVEAMVDQQVKGADRLKRLLQDRKKFITAALIGNSLANTVLSAFATAITIEVSNSLGISHQGLAIAVMTIFITLVILIFAEITPKTMAIKSTESWSLFLARPVEWVIFILNPAIQFLNWISSGIAKLFGVNAQKAMQLLTEEEILMMVKLGRDTGVLEEEKKNMIHSIFEFSDTVVREIMTPRPDCICIDVHKTVADAIHLIVEHGHSRIPVFEDRIDNVIGVLYAKDLLGLDPSLNKENLRKFFREPVFIPETKNIESLLQQMKRQKFQLAVVLDEYSGMSGIVTFEDIIEEIIGEIQDEYDSEADLELIEVNPGQYRAKASINVDDLSQKLNLPLPEDEEFDTLGGLVLHLFGRFPKKGEAVPYNGYVFTVAELHKRRIITVDIKAVASGEDRTE